MPIDNGAGYSEDTALKQHDFEYVLKVLLRVARSCMQKDWAHKEFLYFDLNAGPGIVEGIEGSPLIFTRAALGMDLPFRAFFFEEKAENATRLAEALEGVCTDHRRAQLTVIPGDHNWTVPWAIQEYLKETPQKWVYGLGYGDGNGKQDTPAGPMALLADRFPHVDHLLNVNATIYKRLRGTGSDVSFLLNDLNGIGKRHRLIRKPVGKWQWTMLLMTNWADVPQFDRIGFRRLDTPEGRCIAEEVNFSKRERGESSSPLGAWRPRSRIGPTPSTSGTPGSSPSAPSSSNAAAASANGAIRPAQPSPIT